MLYAPKPTFVPSCICVLGLPVLLTACLSCAWLSCRVLCVHAMYCAGQGSAFDSPSLMHRRVAANNTVVVKASSTCVQLLNTTLPVSSVPSLPGFRGTPLSFSSSRQLARLVDMLCAQAQRAGDLPGPAHLLLHSFVSLCCWCTAKGISLGWALWICPARHVTPL